MSSKSDKYCFVAQADGTLTVSGFKATSGKVWLKCYSTAYTAIKPLIPDKTLDNFNGDADFASSFKFTSNANGVTVGGTGPVKKGYGYVVEMYYVSSGGSYTFTVSAPGSTPTPVTTYTITYSPGAYGTGSEVKDIKTKGKTLTLRGAIFTSKRTGYSQKGWSTTDNGKKAYALSASYADEGSKTLYPYWEKDVVRSVSVTWDANGGQFDEGVTTDGRSYEAAKTFGELPASPEWSGYTFAGWFTQKSGGTQVSATTTVSSVVSASATSTTLYAHWTKNPEPDDELECGSGSSSFGTRTMPFTVEGSYGDNGATSFSFVAGASGTQSVWLYSTTAQNSYLTATLSGNATDVVLSLVDTQTYAFVKGRSYTVTLDRGMYNSSRPSGDMTFKLQFGGSAPKIPFIATPKVTAVLIGSDVRVTWNAVAGAKKYHVYRDYDCPKTGFPYFGSEIEVVEAGACSVLDENPWDVVAGGKCWYYVYAEGDDVSSRFSGQSNAVECKSSPDQDPDPDLDSGDELTMVTFYAEGGDPEVSGQSAYVGDAVGELPEVSRVGHDFLGWFTASDGGVEITEETVVVKNMVAYAHWVRMSDFWPAGEDVEISAPETTLAGSLSWSAKNLPKGLKINAKTGVISGVPAQPGSYVVKVTAKSGSKSESQDVVVTVGNYCDEILPLADGYDARVGVKTLFELGDDFGGCRVTGLPTGFKFAAKALTDKTFGEIEAGTIYGIPSKACTNCIIFTKKDGSVSHTASAWLNVASAPAWSVGTFNGRVDNGVGSATLTVATGGKISGKIVAAGKTWSFSATGYEAMSGIEDEELSIVATAKSGKLTANVQIDVDNGGATGTLSGDELEGGLTLWRNEWKDKGASDRLKPYDGLYTVQLCDDDTGTGYLSLTLDAKRGVCKATGKLPDGTAASGSLPLAWNDDAPMAIWQASPSTYKGGYVGGLLQWSTAEEEVTEPAAFTVGSDEIVWVSLAPTATESYGDGFVRTLSANGAYYNKLAVLSEYYASLTFGADAPALDATVKTTDYNENGKRVTTGETAGIEASEPDCWGNLTVSLDKRGTAFVVDQGKATKPTQDKETKEWSYAGENDAALTLSFAKATGIFRGSFVCWYDYVSATDNTKDPAKETVTHTSKKISFEGVMVLGDSLRGFYLWDRTGTYEDEKTGKAKTFKHRESHAVAFE